MELSLGAFKTDTRGYVTSSGFVAILDVVRNVVVARLLGPYEIGLCTTLLVIPQLAQYLDMGLIEAMAVLVPHNRGRSNPLRAESLKITVWNTTLLIAFGLFLFLTLYAFVHPAEHQRVNMYMLFVGLLVILWKLRQFLLACYTADGNIVRAGWIEFRFALIVTVTSTIGVYYLSGYGFWLGLIVSNLAIILYGLRDYPYKVRLFEPNYEELKQVIPFSLIVLLSSLAYTPFIVLSRLFLAATAGMHEVGLFLLSVLIISKVTILPNAIARSMLPRLSLSVSQSGGLERVFGVFVKAQIYTFAIVCGVVLIGVVLLGPTVSWLLPGYANGIPAANITLFGGIPYSLIYNANNLLLALQQKAAYLKILGITIWVQVMSFAYLWREQLVSASNVSLALLLVFSCYGILVNWKAVELYRSSRLT